MSQTHSDGSVSDCDGDFQPDTSVTWMHQNFNLNFSTGVGLLLPVRSRNPDCAGLYEYGPFDNHSASSLPTPLKLTCIRTSSIMTSTSTWSGSEFLSWPDVSRLDPGSVLVLWSYYLRLRSHNGIKSSRHRSPMDEINGCSAEHQVES